MPAEALTILAEQLCDSPKWDKMFKSRPSKICGRQPLKDLRGYGLSKADHIPSCFLKAVFHKF